MKFIYNAMPYNVFQDRLSELASYRTYYKVELHLCKENK